MPNYDPYKEFEGLAAWSVVDRAIARLVQNKDLIEQTDRRHLVGLIVRELSDSGVLKVRVDAE